MKRALLLCCLVVAARAACAQSQDAAPTANQTQARAALDAMVRALGGEAWLGMKDAYEQGRTSGFYHGNPTGAITDFFDWRVPQDEEERLELTKKHDVIELFLPKECIEVTYKGKHPLPQEQCDDSLRRRDHSIDVAIRVWLKDPATVLIDDGKALAERHLAEQVTLVSSTNEAITIQMDADTHLPLRRSFQWRDPLYHDKNEEVEEYDDYHLIQGIQTPFTVTRFHNGDMTNQRFIYKAAYNVPLPPQGFDPDASAARVKK